LLEVIRLELVVDGVCRNAARRVYEIGAHASSGCVLRSSLDSTRCE